MTDNKVISFLEHKIFRAESTDELYVDCVNVKYLKAALDLINRQKAEIERLEHIRKGDEQLINSLNKCYRLAKSEAIKEFAERLKSRLANLSVQTKTHGIKTTPNYVDDIANQILHDVVPQKNRQPCKRNDGGQQWIEQNTYNFVKKFQCTRQQSERYRKNCL